MVPPCVVVSILGVVGCCVPFGWAAPKPPWGAAPRGPAGSGGGPHFSREMGRKRAGSPVIGRWRRWNRCRVDPATWVPRRLRRGSPAFFGRKPEERTPGASPWTPGFMARLLPLARFGVCATLSRWRGYYGTHVRALIWRLSFIKCFFSIFFTRKCVPNRS